MALSIKNDEVARLAKDLARARGSTVTKAVFEALREALLRERGRRSAVRAEDEIREIAERCAALPVLDPRTPDEILGYDRRGGFGSGPGHVRRRRRSAR